MEDLKQFILEKSQYFNMKVICEKAGVNYSTFRGWKNNGNALSEEKLRLLKNTIVNQCFQRRRKYECYKSRNQTIFN